MSKFNETLLNPKNWFLSGKDKARFNAKRSFYGESLERAIADIDYSGLGEENNGLKLAHLEIDKKYNRVDDAEYNKSKATFSGEPYVSVVKVHVDPEKPSEGAFELDWNEIFVSQLMEAGYLAPSPELIIKAWFDEVCANVARENGAVFPNEIEEFKHKTAATRKVKNESGKIEVL